MKRFHGATACLQANGPTPPKSLVELEQVPFTKPNHSRVHAGQNGKVAPMRPSISIEALIVGALFPETWAVDGSTPLALPRLAAMGERARRDLAAKRRASTAIPAVARLGHGAEPISASRAA